MSIEETQPRDRLSAWCGAVMVGLAVLTPVASWLAPLAFAPLVSLAGLLCLPALARPQVNRTTLALLLLATGWAVLSRLWSPVETVSLEKSTGLKLGLQLMLYWAAICGARQAAPASMRLALQILAWGLAAGGLVLLAEALTGASLYRAIRAAIGDPTDFPMARKNLAQGAFSLALLWPIAATAGARAGAPVWLGVVMATGVAVASYIFLADAPVLAAGLALLVMAGVAFSPKRGPEAAGVLAAVAVLLMPVVALAFSVLKVADKLPLSWSQRVGYWSYAVDRIAEHPWRGWGLDASRTFSPHIQLHPHNGAIQIWLELGAIGAVLTALIWVMTFRKLASPSRDMVLAGAAAAAAVYLLFGLVSFGVWQEWWLALAALTAIVTAMGRSLPARP